MSFNTLFRIWVTLHGFLCFVHKMYLFANYSLVSFFFLKDKNLWFSSQRRREGVVRMLMAALANIMSIVYCVSALCQKWQGFLQKCINCYSNNPNLKCHFAKINLH